MPNPKTNAPNLRTQPPPGQLPDPGPPERERLRDIIIVFVTYPVVPTPEAERTGRRHPWLETVSLALKVALAAYALWETVWGGGG